MEIFLHEQEGYGSGTQFINNYPEVWSAYTSSVTSSGYTGDYGNFVTQYYDNVSSGQTTNNNGTNGFYVTWETNFTYTNGKRQEVRDKDGNLVGIILPEVGVGVEKHSVFVPYGGIEGVDYVLGSDGTPYGLISYNGPKYIGGTVPVPGMGVIGRYGDLIKLTKGYKGAIQAHHLIETRFLKLFGISKNNAPAIILDKAKHQEITNILSTNMPYGEAYAKRQVIETYQKVYSSEWMDYIKILLGY